MECNPVHSIKAADPWCDSHRRSVIICIREINLQIDELKRTICLGICGVDFPGFQYGEHMPRCPLRTPCQRAHTPTSMPALYQDGIRSIQCGNCDIQIPILPPVTEKRVEVVPKKCAVCGWSAHSGRCGEQGGSGPKDGQ